MSKWRRRSIFECLVFDDSQVRFRWPKHAISKLFKQPWNVTNWSTAKPQKGLHDSILLGSACEIKIHVSSKKGSRPMLKHFIGQNISYHIPMSNCTSGLRELHKQFKKWPREKKPKLAVIYQTRPHNKFVPVLIDIIQKWKAHSRRFPSGTAWWRWARTSQSRWNLAINATCFRAIWDGLIVRCTQPIFADIATLPLRRLAIYKRQSIYHKQCKKTSWRWRGSNEVE